MQSFSAQDDLDNYQNRLRFPKKLEGEFLMDFGERHPPALRRFFGLGLILYIAFTILDYWALPISYPIAWRLRLAFGAVMFALFFNTNTKIFRRSILWISAAWAFWAGLSILIMIYVAHAEEQGYIFYAFGLMLIITAIYGPSSGDLLYPSIAGWVTTFIYVIIGIFDQNLLATPDSKLTFFIVCFFLVGMNILGMIAGYMLVLSQRRDFLQRRVIEEQRSNEEHLRAQADRVLHNILPASVAERLKHGEVVADSYEEASVLFADMVNFTPFSSNLTPSQIVTVLNEIFSQFDLLAERYKLEKIKTTGDGYMVAAGLHLHCSDHAEVLVRLGLDMCEYFNRQVFSGQKLGLRVGINSGPVMAAVIGLQRFSYDLWGDAVNVAKRMESHGQSGVVQITEATYDKVKGKFICKHQGRIEIKGKGKMSVWHVVKPNG